MLTARALFFQYRLATLSRDTMHQSPISDRQVTLLIPTGPERNGNGDKYGEYYNRPSGAEYPDCGVQEG
jgi:hypothetical protein